MSHKIPNSPWSKAGSDNFEWRRKHYLLLVDYYSDRIEFDLMRNQTAAEIINLMQKHFARWGIPEDIVTDNGTNYDSVEVSQFCKRTTSNTPNLHLITARVMETLNLTHSPLVWQHLRHKDSLTVHKNRNTHQRNFTYTENCRESVRRRNQENQEIWSLL